MLQLHTDGRIADGRIVRKTLPVAGVGFVGPIRIIGKLHQIQVGLILGKIPLDMYPEKRSDEVLVDIVQAAIVPSRFLIMYVLAVMLLRQRRRRVGRNLMNRAFVGESK